VSAYAPAGHPALRETPRLEAMVPYRWSVPFAMSVSYRFESAFFRHNLPIPIQSLNASSISMTKIGALRSGLLAMLPASSVVREVSEGVLQRLDIPALDFRFVTGLIHRTDCTNLHLVQRLLGHLRSVAGGHKD
jgi:DNA-binding transcriptional LysR family regulator